MLKFHCLLLKASALAGTGEAAPREGWDVGVSPWEKVRERAAAT